MTEDQARNFSFAALGELCRVFRSHNIHDASTASRLILVGLMLARSCEIPLEAVIKQCEAFYAESLDPAKVN